MSKLFDAAKWLWMEVKLGGPPFVQDTAIPLLHKTKEITRMLLKPYIPLYELQGENQAGPLTVTYGGLGYAKPLLKSLLFVGKPEQREIGRLMVWRPGEALRALDSDLTIIESSQYLTRKLSPRGAITLPFRVRFILDVQGEWEEVEGRLRRDARRNDVRKAKKLGYEYEISHSEADLEMFYHEMYLPTMQKRHGTLAALLPRQEAQQLMRHGLLFLVKRDGARVAGGLCHVQQGILGFKEMGVLNGDKQLMKEGAVGAMNYLRILWAHQQGCQGVNLGSCWPYLSGIFKNKRKWGATVSVSPHEHKQIWIRVQQDTPAVSHFFKDNPCVIMNSRQELQALFVTDSPGDVPSKTRSRWQKRYETPGLSGFAVRSVADLISSN